MVLHLNHLAKMYGLFRAQGEALAQLAVGAMEHGAAPCDKHGHNRDIEDLREPGT